jgi:peptide chain release factor subunit 1
MALTDEIERLSRVHSTDGVLSVYVAVDPTIAYRRDHQIAAAKSALRGLEKTVADEKRSSFEHERDRFFDFLEHDWTEESRSVAIFSSQPAGLWKTIPLSVRMQSQAFFGPRPRIFPLAQVADEYERYCAVFVSKEDSKLLLISMGEVEEERAVSDEVPGRHDQGGWSQARYQLHREFHVLEHLKRALAALEDYYGASPFQRLIVCGPEEVTTEFINLLPTPLRDCLIAAVSCPSTASRDQVMAAVAPAIHDFERSQEEALLTKISELADAGGHAVLGLDATLGAIGDGRVHELAVADGVSARGRECLSCGHLDTQSVASCPKCGASLASMDLVDDIIERAAEKVYAQRGRVEVVFGDARESLIARGGLGALLRF